jgi:hypothetical protein
MAADSPFLRRADRAFGDAAAGDRMREPAGYGRMPQRGLIMSVSELPKPARTGHNKTSRR